MDFEVRGLCLMRKMIARIDLIPVEVGFLNKLVNAKERDDG